MSEDISKAEGGLTRREMLKKSALVGAVAWAVPIVGSFNAPAFAQVAVSPSACTNFDCFGPEPDTCGTGTGLSTCICDTTDPEGTPSCQDGALSCFGLPECSTTGDCPPGWGCFHDSCCGDPGGIGGICAPPCGVSAVLPNNTGATTGATGGPTFGSL